MVALIQQEWIDVCVCVLCVACYVLRLHVMWYVVCGVPYVLCLLSLHVCMGGCMGVCYALQVVCVCVCVCVCTGASASACHSHSINFLRVYLKPN